MGELGRLRHLSISAFIASNAGQPGINLRPSANTCLAITGMLSLQRAFETSSQPLT